MIVTGLGTAVPSAGIDQAAAVDVALPLLGAEGRRERLLRALYRRAGVRRRHSVLLAADGDAGVQPFYEPRRGRSDRGPATARRMAVYADSALGLARQAGRRALEVARADGADVTHLVTVSCTGFDAPGVDVGLIRELGMASTSTRLHLGFMGCHGMFNGLELARTIVAGDARAIVLVVAVELCSLHFQYSWDSEKLVANSLFADGAAAAVCTGEVAGGGLLRIPATGSFLFPDCESAMTWRIGDYGFEMTLDPSVPGLIRDHVGDWIEDWLGTLARSVEQIGIWAVHPGGPRILRAVEDALGLAPEALAASRGVLSDYGNMSSATIGFILERIVARGLRGPGVAIGFGPGLVGEAFLFELS